MENPKAQADIVSAVLIVMIAIGLTATAFAWGLPLIQKRQDTVVLERVSSYFDQGNANSLPSRIEFVANNGGDQTFALDTNGFWLLRACPTGEISSCNPQPGTDVTKENNSIEFTFFSKVSKIAAGAGYVSLTPGSSCPPSSGIVGKDKSSVVCAKSVSRHDGFEITYRIWFRQVSDAASDRGFKIDLTKHESGVYNFTGKVVKMSRQNINQILVGGKTLIIPEIKILLE